MDDAGSVRWEQVFEELEKARDGGATVTEMVSEREVLVYRNGPLPRKMPSAYRVIKVRLHDPVMPEPEHNIPMPD